MIRKQHVKGAIKPYYQFSGKLSLQQSLLLKGTGLVVTTTMRLDILDKLHEGHLGITNRFEQAKISVWWPEQNKQLDDMIKNCNICINPIPGGISPSYSGGMANLPPLFFL